MHDFVETLAVPGAWTATLTIPAIPAPVVRAALTGIARDLDLPVDAALIGTEEAITTALLYRDPSRTHGAPDIDACEAAVDLIVSETGWARQPAAPPALTVPMGLKPGYHTTARFDPAAARAVLAQTCGASGWELTPAILMSARPVGTEMRTYHEHGALVRARPRLLTGVATAARLLGQLRWVGIDESTGRTVVMARPCECGQGRG
ncbi:hypothetical protein [Actinokineospora enzanensis]|uniref:hypothetical protein n=1 Tax=Actinokineospora enzanensis TaxID=155975 RepID=UPI000377D18E|nr:hypothetical protein [Actinokineospora enzanensis]